MRDFNSTPIAIGFLVYVRYTRKGTALPCPYTWRYNVVPHVNGNRYIETLDCFFATACVLNYFLYSKRIVPRYPCAVNADNSGRSAIRKLHCVEDVVHFYFEA